MIYFDHNATSPLSPVARAAWLDAVERFPANPSSPHRAGQRAETALDGAREALGGALGCGAGEIVFTSGATESNNAVLFHASRAGGEVWLSAIEHPCVVESAKRWLPGRHRWLPVSAEGVLDLDALADALKGARPALVGVMAANNETGALQPWREARELCAGHGVPFFCDAAQWLGKLPAAGLGDCDFVSGCGHKFGGPVGVGFLKCPAQTVPLLVGGSQEEGRRAGTQNVPGVLAMVAALGERGVSVSAEGAVLQRAAVRRWFAESLASGVEGARVLGPRDGVLWNTVSALLPAPGDCRRRWVVVLDRMGFAVSTGSACASGKEQASQVLTAMGIAPGDAGRALRFSGGWDTTREEWGRLLDAIRAAAVELGCGR